MELVDIRGQEGIPHLYMYGIWARLVVGNASHFCHLLGYRTGFILTKVRMNGGLMWNNVYLEKCRDNMTVECIDRRQVMLTDEWYDGNYIICERESGGTIKI
jgi:hypothetical protein